MTNKVCGNCNAWERHEGQKLGICRRNPPTPVGLGMLPKAPDAKTLMQPNQGPTLQPVVMNFYPETFDNGWCRDGWQPLDETVIEGDRSPVDFSKLRLEGTA